MTRTLRSLVSTALVVAVAHSATVRAQAQSSGSRPTEGWRIKFEGSGSRPVIVDGVLYVGSADGAVYALDPLTGNTKWRFQTGARLAPATSGVQVITVPPGGSAIGAAVSFADRQQKEGRRRVDMAPAVASGTVFIGSGDHSFYAIDAATGTMKWSYEAGGGMAATNNLSFPWPAAVVRNGSAYFVTDDGLHAVDALTGKRQWLFETLQDTVVGNARKRTPLGPVLGDGTFFLTAWPFGLSSTPKAFLYAVDAASGKARWVTTVDGTFATAPVTAKGLVFFATNDRSPSGRILANSATLYAVGEADGQVKWKFAAALEFSTTNLLAAGNAIYFSTDKSVSALEVETGRQLWTFSPNEIARGLWADDRHLYMVSRKGSRLHALDLSTGQEKWSREVGRSFDVAIISEGVVYGGGENLYALDAATGKQLWSTKGLGSAHLIDGGRLFSILPTTSYFGTDKVDQGYLSAIDAKTGKLALSK